ncbi:MAG TPA: hypothetical protein VK961_05375, partial [Chthoniobacter sp.]|nr:hypothetical protein [Chthoniobacter sp.]
MKSRVVTSIRLAIESLLDRLRENSLFRSISRRYGRRYWQLPRLLRRRLYFEASASSLPGARTWKFGRGEMVEAAAGIAKIDTPLDEQRMVARPFKTRPPAVTRLDEAWLVGKYAAPITPRGRLILSAFRDEPGILGLETHPDIEAWLLTPDAAKAELPELEHVWPMVNRLQGNYYHWLIEWCGRLEQIEAYGAQVGNLPRLLIPEKGPDYIRASLKLLGFAPETWIPWSESSAPRKIHGLVLPSFRGSSLGASPASLQWLRRRFLGAAGS